MSSFGVPEHFLNEIFLKCSRIPKSVNTYHKALFWSVKKKHLLVRKKLIPSFQALLAFFKVAEFQSSIFSFFSENVGFIKNTGKSESLNFAELREKCVDHQNVLFLRNFQKIRIEHNNWTKNCMIEWTDWNFVFSTIM